MRGRGDEGMRGYVKREGETRVDVGGAFDDMMFGNWREYLLIFILLGLWVWIWIC